MIEKSTDWVCNDNKGLLFNVGDVKSVLASSSVKYILKY